MRLRPDFDTISTTKGWLGRWRGEANSNKDLISIEVTQYHLAGSPPIVVGARVNLRYYEGTDLGDLRTLQNIIQETLKE